MPHRRDGQWGTGNVFRSTETLQVLCEYSGLLRSVGHQRFLDQGCVGVDTRLLEEVSDRADVHCLLENPLLKSVLRLRSCTVRSRRGTSFTYVLTDR